MCTIQEKFRETQEQVNEESRSSFSRGVGVRMQKDKKKEARLIRVIKIKNDKVDDE